MGSLAHHVSGEAIMPASAPKTPLNIAVLTVSDTRNETSDTSGQYPVSYTHLRAHETVLDLVCRLLLEKKKKKQTRDVYIHKSKTRQAHMENRAHKIQQPTRLIEKINTTKHTKHRYKE